MKLKTLDEIGNIQTGTTPKTSEPENFGDYIPFIKPSDFNADGTLCLESCEYLSEIGIGKGRLIPKHSVLMTCIGSIGKCGYNDIDVSCNQQINALTPHNDNYKYIYYVMKSGEFQTRIQNICPKTVVPIINKTLWGKLEISLPSREEQDKIVSILDKADEIRAKKKLANDKLDEFLKSTFISMFGDPVRNEQKYPKQALCSLCNKITDGTHDTPPRYDSGVMIITGKNIRPFKIDYSQLDYVTEADHKIIYERCNPEYGDVLYTNIGVNLGTAVMNNIHEEFSMKNVALLKNKREVLNSRFLEHILNFNTTKSEIIRISSLGGAQKFLSLQQIRNFEIIVPPIEDQNKFAQIVEHVEVQKQKNELVIEQMNNLFNSLSQRAFKGEL